MCNVQSSPYNIKIRPNFFIYRSHLSIFLWFSCFPVKNKRKWKEAAEGDHGPRGLTFLGKFGHQTTQGKKESGKTLPFPHFPPFQMSPIFFLFSIKNMITHEYETVFPEICRAQVWLCLLYYMNSPYYRNLFCAKCEKKRVILVIKSK